MRAGQLIVVPRLKMRGRGKDAVYCRVNSDGVMQMQLQMRDLHTTRITRTITVNYDAASLRKSS